MPLKFAPLPGTILKCDFRDLLKPEMVKPRPVIVLSPKEKHVNRKTVIIVALSTTAPEVVCKYHRKLTLPGLKLPENLEQECWLKGDMVYCFSLGTVLILFV